MVEGGRPISYVFDPQSFKTHYVAGIRDYLSLGANSQSTFFGFFNLSSPSNTLTVDSSASDADTDADRGRDTQRETQASVGLDKFTRTPTASKGNGYGSLGDDDSSKAQSPKDDQTSTFQQSAETSVSVPGVHNVCAACEQAQYSPEAHIGLFTRLSFRFLNPLMSRGSDHPLRFDELMSPRKEDRSESVVCCVCVCVFVSVSDYGYVRMRCSSATGSRRFTATRSAVVS